MKKNLIIFFTFFLFFPLWVCAQEVSSIALKLPPYYATQVCGAPIWKNFTGVWKGVEDKRPKKEIGVVTVRGEDPINVLSSPELKVTIGEALKGVLSACGMKLVPSPTESSYDVSVEISEFYGDLDKKIVSSKGVAKSRLIFVIEKSAQKKTIEVSYAIETKKIRKRGVEQLEETLNELLLKTLEQIPTVRQFKELNI